MNGTKIVLTPGDKIELLYSFLKVEVDISDSQIRVQICGVTVYPNTELLTWIREQARLEDISSKEWAEAGNKEQAAFRSGMVYALEQVEHKLRGDGKEG